MLPQLSYVVAQAGVDARPLPPLPSMLPRLSKPFYSQNESSHPDQHTWHNNSPHSLHRFASSTPSSSCISSTLVPTPYAYPSSLPHHAPTPGPGHIPPQQKSALSSMIISPYHPPLSPPPPQSQPPITTQHHYSPKDPWTANGSFIDQQQTVSDRDTSQRRPSRGFTVPDTPTTTWHGGHTSPSEYPGHHEAVADSEAATTHCYTSHRVELLKEWNELLTWMDHQFCEQKEDAYQKKLNSLQQELKSLQSDGHEIYLELVADLNLKRESMIADAACFLKYQQEWVEQLHQEDMTVIEEEYQVERRNLHDAIIAVIEDRKKQVKEDKENGLINIKDLFSEAYSRVTNKRTLRKRPAAEFIRQETRKRHARHGVSHHSETSLGKEEDELDEDLMLMKQESHVLATVG